MKDRISDTDRLAEEIATMVSEQKLMVLVVMEFDYYRNRLVDALERHLKERSIKHQKRRRYEFTISDNRHRGSTVKIIRAGEAVFGLQTDRLVLFDKFPRDAVEHWMCRLSPHGLMMDRAPKEPEDR